MSSSSSRGRVRVIRDNSGNVRVADLGTVRGPSVRDLVVDPALVEHATEDGYRAGYDAGFNAGLEDAAAAIASRERTRSEQLNAVLELLAHEVDVIAQRHAEVIDEIEHQAVATATAIAEILVGRELRATEDRGLDGVRRALAFAPPHGPVVARLHPDDVQSLGDPNAVLVGRALSVIADPSLQPGDALVDVGPARIDARISQALQRIHEVLES